jgi:small subunit ribosomal protein S8
MSVSDPIADMLTRIRNAVMAGHQTVTVPSSKIKLAIVQILEKEGYIEGFEELETAGRVFKTLRIHIKYTGERRERRHVLTGLKRVSRPGRRVYASRKEIPWVRSGIGISILSTPKGVMTGNRARQLGVGGEILCEIW